MHVYVVRNGTECNVCMHERLCVWVYACLFGCCSVFFVCLWACVVYVRLFY